MPRPRDAVGNSSIDEGAIATPEIADEMHDGSDRVGDLRRDLELDLDDRGELDDDEVWFEAEQLAAASRVDLGVDLKVDLDGDLLARAPAIDRLAAAITTPGISLSRLPGWPDAGPAGQGLGALADELIGELRPGDVLVLAGAQRGIGRTSLLAQLGDALALVEPGAGERPATPVVFVGADAPALWRARSLARYFGVDARIFVDAARAQAAPRFEAMLAEFAASAWATLDARQRFLAPEALAGGAERRAATIAALRRWQLDHGERCWPILIVDAVEPLGEPTRALTELAELAAAEGWIVLAGCDLGDDERARARAIDRVASVRVRLRAGAEDDALTLEACHRRLGPRGRGRLRWHRSSGRLRAE